ncbi:hypothetical protein HPP92_009542 [Vanilla planifolia]|uniref:Uncharacterized protein n=1 Tax=Vanilla planifolia TaxID=51239 RepID=A0A835V6Q4_VANPL|nr:hypothetical protein HPP92_009542 [Vanilla planifolia]
MKARPSTMRECTSCFSDRAVKIATSSSFGSGSTTKASSASAANVSNIGAVTSFFKSSLTTGKFLVLKLTWSRSHSGPFFSVDVDESLISADTWKRTHLLRTKSGTHTFLASSSNITVHWDFTAAQYGPGPEPIDKFYLAVTADSEFALLLGDKSEEFEKKFTPKLKIAEFSMVRRREQVIGPALHSTTSARFCDGGKYHEITIKCKGTRREEKDAELSVCIDKKIVVQVAKLDWNFRGNQAVFIDGSPVDLMWDMHGWWFGAPAGHAFFLFRRRSTLESRLWLEEESTHGFSLLIEARRAS